MQRIQRVANPVQDRLNVLFASHSEPQQGFGEIAFVQVGVEKGSQNNANTTLVFQAPLSGEQHLSTTGSSQQDLSWDDSPDYEAGVIIELSTPFTSSESTVQILGQAFFLYSPFEIEGGGSTFQTTRTDTRNELSGTLTDSYAVPSGVILPLAPYSQCSATPPPGFYPRIADEPTRSKVFLALNNSGIFSVFI